MKTLDNVFNHLTKTIRQQVSDDDQIKSWALQAIRHFNIPDLHWVKDVQFIDIINHQGVIPTDIIPDKIQTVKILASIASDINSSTTDAETTTTITTVQSGTNITMTNVTDTVTIAENAIFNSELLSIVNDSNIFYPMVKVMNIDQNYFCKVVTSNDCLFYSINDGLILSNVQSGIIAVEYYKELTVDGDYIFPDEPIVMWDYMATYIREQYWKELTDMGTQGAEGTYQRTKAERAALMSSTKSKLIHQRVSIRALKKLQYGSNILTRIPQYRNNVYQRLERYGG